jgi:hypothetical protein
VGEEVSMDMQIQFTRGKGCVGMEVRRRVGE